MFPNVRICTTIQDQGSQDLTSDAVALQEQYLADVDSLNRRRQVFPEPIPKSVCLQYRPGYNICSCRDLT